MTGDKVTMEENSNNDPDSEAKRLKLDTPNCPNAKSADVDYVGSVTVTPTTTPVREDNGKNGNEGHEENGNSNDDHEDQGNEDNGHEDHKDNGNEVEDDDDDVQVLMEFEDVLSEYSKEDSGSESGDDGDVEVESYSEDDSESDNGDGGDPQVSGYSEDDSESESESDTDLSDDESHFESGSKPRFSLLPRDEDCKSVTVPLPQPQKGKNGSNSGSNPTSPCDALTPDSLDEPLKIKKADWNEEEKVYDVEYFPVWRRAENVSKEVADADGLVSEYNRELESSKLYMTKSKNATSFTVDPPSPSVDPMMEVKEVKAKPYSICAICGPRFAFPTHQMLKTHVDTIHQASIVKEFEILGSCPRCARPASKILSFPLHAMWCYEVKGFEVDIDGDVNGSVDLDKLEAEIDLQLQRKIVFNENASTPTEHALNELAKYAEQHPDALKMELIGNEVHSPPAESVSPPVPARCEIKYCDLRFCLDSSKGKATRLTEKMTACVFGTKVGRVVNPLAAFASEVKGITDFVLKHFGNNGKVTEQKLREVVAETFTKRRKYLRTQRELNELRRKSEEMRNEDGNKSVI